MLKLEQFWPHFDERAVDQLRSAFCRSVITITGSEIMARFRKKYGISPNNLASDDLRWPHYWPERKKNTEIFLNDLNESYRTPFLHLYIPRSFLLSRCDHFAPPPHTHTHKHTAKVVGSATRERIKRCIAINHCANAWTQHSTGWNETYSWVQLQNIEHLVAAA